MQDNKTELPEGTDRIIAGASDPTVSNSGAMGVRTDPETDVTDDDDVLLVGDVGDSDDSGGPAGKRKALARGALADKFRSGRDKLSGQAADKARGLVSQGLERSAEALGNVGRLVGDTADGLDERLGADYGDYARRAATAIDDAATSLAGKDADELIDDTREFVRKSPGIALAGAAIVGFALARLVKTGLARDDGRGKGRGGSGKSGGSREG
ncbi:MAG: hypothetical protein ABI626_01230 [Sphingomicrobium sp.]